METQASLIKQIRLLQLQCRQHIQEKSDRKVKKDVKDKTCFRRGITRAKLPRAQPLNNSTKTCVTEQTT